MDASPVAPCMTMKMSQSSALLAKLTVFVWITSNASLLVADSDVRFDRDVRPILAAQVLWLPWP